MATGNSGRYIFLVDDEPIQNEMLKDYISERYDYQLKTYESGEAVLKDMHLAPAIVVLDYHLNASRPDAQNGVEILKLIRKDHPKTKVVMLSGQDKLDVAVESMKYGAYDYVVKSETAFARMGNVVNNINELHSAKQNNRTYRRIITLMSILVTAILIMAVYLAKKYN